MRGVCIHRRLAFLVMIAGVFAGAFDAAAERTTARLLIGSRFARCL